MHMGGLHLVFVFLHKSMQLGNIRNGRSAPLWGWTANLIHSQLKWLLSFPLKLACNRQTVLDLVEAETATRPRMMI